MVYSYHEAGRHGLNEENKMKTVVDINCGNGEESDEINTVFILPDNLDFNQLVEDFCVERNILAYSYTRTVDYKFRDQGKEFSSSIDFTCKSESQRKSMIKDDKKYYNRPNYSNLKCILHAPVINTHYRYIEDKTIFFEYLKSKGVIIDFNAQTLTEVIK